MMLSDVKCDRAMVGCMRPLAPAVLPPTRLATRLAARGRCATRIGYAAIATPYVPLQQTSGRGAVCVRGSSKGSVFAEQLVRPLMEPAPGFDSIAAALDDLAAGTCIYSYSKSV